MKSLQILLATSLLLVAAGAAHASTSATSTSDSLTADSFSQDAPQTSIRQPGSQDSGDSSGATRHGDDSVRPGSRLPAGDGKAPDARPAESVRAPSWQSLLPGSIQ